MDTADVMLIIAIFGVPLSVIILAIVLQLRDRREKPKLTLVPQEIVETAAIKASEQFGAPEKFKVLSPLTAPKKRNNRKKKAKNARKN